MQARWTYALATVGMAALLAGCSEALPLSQLPDLAKLPEKVLNKDEQKGKVSEMIEKKRVVNLVTLIQLRLAARRYYDFGDVAQLIRVHRLDEAYLKKLHPSVHRDFIECLEEKRREDEYEAREG